jgi:alpha-methylacyl-CoA racemase
VTTDLSGITFLDLAGVGPAARCSRALSDLGARWIRLTPPATAGRVVPEWTGYGALRGAEPFELDLGHPRARSVFERLVIKSDVVVEGFRPGVADRLGIGFNDMNIVNPKIIYCSATGYGQSGPLAMDVGHDINYQAVAGGFALVRHSDDATIPNPGITVADCAGGWQAAMRILAALVDRGRTGRGKYVDVSASQSVLQFMSVAIDRQIGTDIPSREMILYGRYACYAIYETLDGGAIAVGAYEPKFFSNLCEVLGLESLVSRQYDGAAQAELFQSLSATFKQNTREEWLLRFEGVAACVSPVLSIDEVSRFPHWIDTEAIRDYEHPTHGTVRQVGPLGDGERGPVPPGVSAYEEILISFGFSPEEVGSLHRDGVVK